MEKKGDLVAIRPEAIIEARFSLSRWQNDILDMVFSKIKDDDNLKYDITVAQYIKLYNFATNNVYRDLKKAIKAFEGQGFNIINKETGQEDYFAWFSRISYRSKEGKIIVSIDPDLKKIFIEVKKRIYYNIKYTLNFTCVYSKRLYYYLKSFEDTGWRIDNVEQLKHKLECPSSYKNFADFKKRVLDPSFKEINSNSDIYFNYETIKKGRKIEKIKFLVKKKNLDQNLVENKNENDYEMFEVIKPSLTQKQKDTLVLEAKGDKEKITKAINLSIYALNTILL